MKTFHWNNNKNDIKITIKIYDKKPRYNGEGIVEKIELYTNKIISMTYYWGIDALNFNMNKELKLNKCFFIDDIDFYEEKIKIYDGFNTFIISNNECKDFYNWLFSCLSLNYSRKKKINKILN